MARGSLPHPLVEVGLGRAGRRGVRKGEAEVFMKAGLA